MGAPEGGIQPQAMVDAGGTLHVVYLKGDPAAADVFYARREAGKTAFSAPLRVNSQSGSAIALGTIRGAQLALGKNGRVHVAWNGSGQAAPKGPGKGVPMLYSRLNDAGTAFEPQRNLMQFTSNLDGGGTVTADRSGAVYVAWHGSDAAAGEEAARRLWVARSRDAGKSFERERPAFSQPTGACACCSSRAFADSKGKVYLLYRAATNHTGRDMVLLTSQNGGDTFQGGSIHPWKVDT
jgi:hypothetical protein